MDYPSLRYLMDEAYAKKLDELPRGEGEFWPGADGETEECTYWDLQMDQEIQQMTLLAEYMRVSNYPGASFGSLAGGLNVIGEQIVSFNNECGYARNDGEDEIEKDPDREEWHTFRDNTMNCIKIHSIYTNTKARPLKKRWVDAVGRDCTIKNGDL